MSFLSNILKHSGQSVASGVIGAVGSFAASIIVARLLGVQGTATVSMALWLVFLTTTIADVGVTGTLARFAAECPHDDEGSAARRLASFALRIMALAILAGLVLTAVVLWFYWGDIQAKYAAGKTEGLIFCGLVLLCFVVHMLYAFAYQYLRGIRAFRSIALFSLLGTCLQIAGAVSGGMLYGANGALAGYILFSVPMLLGLRRIPLVGRIDPPANRASMRGYALTFYFATLFSPLLWVKADMLIVDQVLGASAVGLFAAAGTIAALLLQVCQMICNALLPNIVHAAQQDRAKFEEASRIAVRLALALLLPACLIAAPAAPEAISAVYGAAFAGGGLTAAILCVACLGSALTLVVASVLSAEQGNKVLARNGVIGAVVTVVAGTGLALSFGLAGAAVGRLLAQGLIGLLNLWSANRRVRGLITANWVFRILAAGALGALTTEAIGWWIGGGLLAIILSLALGGLVYLLAAALLLPFAEEQRSQLKSMFGKMPRVVGAPALWLLARRG